MALTTANITPTLTVTSKNLQQKLRQGLCQSHVPLPMLVHFSAIEISKNSKKEGRL